LQQRPDSTSASSIGFDNNQAPEIQRKEFQNLLQKQKQSRNFAPSNFQKYTFMSYLTAEKKQEIFGKYGKSNTDTGSPEAQIALFSYRISSLTEHLKINAKDYSTERALVMLVGKRRRLLDYLKSKDIERYRSIIKELGIRK
jgi:small subunit ribosomal protein S15